MHPSRARFEGCRGGERERIGSSRKRHKYSRFVGQVGKCSAHSAADHSDGGWQGWHITTVRHSMTEVGHNEIALPAAPAWSYSEPVKEPATFTPGRLRAFVDAVVAIAMTLLILPLLESVSEAADAKLSTATFLAEHRGQLISFLLSFILIAMFWMEHHRQYARTHKISRALLWINVAWMLTIVWLPVPTAMVGQMTPDPLQATLYIGTLIMTQVTTLAGKLYLLRHPSFADFTIDQLRKGVTGDAVSIFLFVVALAGWILGAGYFSLLLLVLADPLEKLLLRWRR